MLDAFMRLMVGFGLSLGLGGLVTRLIHDTIGHHIQNLPADADTTGSRNGPAEPARLFGSHTPLAGSIERSVFTLLTAYNTSGAAVAMIGWLGLKTAVRWSEDMKTTPGKIDAFHALFTEMGSMFFALLGGLFIRGGLF